MPEFKPHGSKPDQEPSGGPSNPSSSGSDSGNSRDALQNISEMFADLDAITPETIYPDASPEPDALDSSFQEPQEVEQEPAATIPTANWISELEAITPTYLESETPQASEEESVSFSLSVPEPIKKKPRQRSRPRSSVPQIRGTLELEGEDFELQEPSGPGQTSPMTVFTTPTLLRPNFKKELKPGEIDKEDYLLLCDINGNLNIGELAQKSGRNLLGVRESLKKLVDLGYVSLSEQNRSERKIRERDELRVPSRLPGGKSSLRRVRLDLVFGLLVLGFLIYAIPKFTDYITSPPAPEKKVFERKEPLKRKRGALPEKAEVLSEQELEDERWKAEVFSRNKPNSEKTLPPKTLEKLKKDSVKWGGAL